MKITNMSLRIFVGVLLVAVYNLMLPAAEANIIDTTYGAGAGSFELGNYSGDIFQPLSVGSTTITGWTVGGPGNGVEWLDSSGYKIDTGLRAVDLDRNTPSSISTVIPTVAGNVYELSFSAATVLGFGDTGAVSAGSLVNQPFTVAIPSNNRFVMTYEPFSFLFTASGATTTIKFVSTNGVNMFGPAIDSVTVDLAPIPLPATVFLLASGLVGLAALRRKSRS